jgi:hypothetical protein
VKLLIGVTALLLMTASAHAQVTPKTKPVDAPKNLLTSGTLVLGSNLTKTLPPTGTYELWQDADDHNRLTCSNGKTFILPSCDDLPPEPMDAPALQEVNGSYIDAAIEVHWSCADKRRVLLTSEDGKKHCILFPTEAH